jgi:hypothetical protein
MDKDINNYSSYILEETKKERTQDLLIKYNKMKKVVDYKKGMPNNPYWWENFEVIKAELRYRNVI